MGSSTALLKVLGFMVPAVAILLGLGQFRVLPSNASVSVHNATRSNAEVAKPKTYRLSNDPVVVYVEDFLTAEEANHLVGLT